MTGHDLEIEGKLVYCICDQPKIIQLFKTGTQDLKGTLPLKEKEVKADILSGFIFAYLICFTDESSGWKPRKTKSSKFDVKSSDGSILQPVGNSANINPGDPYVSQILERYIGVSAVRSIGLPDAGGFSSQQTKHARRLYVGGITPETLEDELGRFLNDLILKAVECSWDDNKGAVLDVYINREKCFAFVELKSVELTTACISFDGIKFTNARGIATTLRLAVIVVYCVMITSSYYLFLPRCRVRRPNDFKPDQVPTILRPVPSVNMARLGLVSSLVNDGPDKVFVGGLPYNLKDEDVKELLSVFGPLKSFHLVCSRFAFKSIRIL